MHFFTEPSALIAQPLSNIYGPNIDEFTVCSTFSVSSQAKVFACQSGQLIVQPYVDITTGNVNNDLVNIILKPGGGLTIPFTPVLYYIYRGVAKSSFISGTAITPENETNTEFIAKFWQNWEQQKIGQGLPTNTPPPEPKSFGFDSELPDTVLIEEIYNSSKSNNTDIQNLQTIRVAEGEWIGNVLSTNEFSFEVIVDTDFLTLDVGYAKKSKYIIDLGNLPLEIPIWTEREKALNYIDPVALFGMHYEEGVGISTYSEGIKQTVTTKGENLYTQVIDKFASKNDVYIDIRSERGYSYNFYNNYDFVTSEGEGNDHQNIQFKAFSDPQYISKLYGWPLTTILNVTIWPIIIYTFDEERVKLKLRIDDNTKPLLFVEDYNLIGGQRDKQFITEKELLQNSIDGWTDEVILTLPVVEVNNEKKNIAYHAKLQYFRQEDNPASPNTVLKSENYLDSVFGGINFPTINVQTTFWNQKYSKRYFVRGNDFEYVTESSLLSDINNVIFLTRKGFGLKNSKNFYPKIDSSIFQSEDNQISENYILPKDILFNKWQVKEGTNTVDVLTIVGYNKNKSLPNPIEDIFMLGLTRAEWNLLNNLYGISEHYQKYLYFEAIPNQYDVDTTTPYKKYRLKVQGINNLGVVTINTPSPEIYVYGTGLNLLASKDFGSNANIPNLIPDPGTFDEGYVDVHRFDYDPNDSIVTDIFPNGKVPIDDFDQKTGDIKYEASIIGEIHYPVDKIGGTNLSNRKTSYPLIVVIHGNGQRYSDYRFLAKHLAKNGFIVSSISCLIVSKRTFDLIPYPGTTAQLFYFYGEDAIYLYNNDPNINNSYLEYEKLSVLNYEYNLSTGTGVTLLSWVKEIDFKINLLGQIPSKLTFLFDVGKHHMAPLGRANILYPHLQIVKSKFGNNVENNIGILGHSRGGEAVVRIAKDINNSTAPSDLKEIKAILSLAPTDMWQQEDLTQNIPYSVLYGSKDGDVSGITLYRPKYSSNKITGTGGFSLYDRANNNNEKSMIFVYKATHNGFITDNHDYTNDNDLINVTIQRFISKAYINAFFRKSLKNENIWKPIFSESIIPKSVNNREIFLQYQNLNQRSLIADFNNITQTQLTQLVSADAGINYELSDLDLKIESSEFKFNNRLDPFSPHFNKGLWVKYPKLGGKISFNIPDTKRNASAFKYLSFRISHVSGDYVNINNIDKNVPDFGNNLDEYDKYFFRLFFNEYKSSNISRIGYVERIDVQLEDSQYKYSIKTSNIPYPDIRPDIFFFTKSAFITVRIPLNEYGDNNIDLEDVRKINLIIPSSPTGGGVAIDDVEFTN